ncbi:AraC family transcriptional regulator [Massilia sp. KIM]|uniref:AraC family transcriptional regulator n=1 Tax=Massilia sp. KIM TaxID=1955422 RepID=UPI0015C2D6C3|nr:AraC family transcriptional regulator [Massilia sp. KIM]
MRARPDFAGDPLSDLLALLQVRSGVPLRMTAGGAWSLRFSGDGSLKFIAQVRGRLCVQVEGEPASFWLEPGDCLLLRGSRPYVAGTDPALAPDDGAAHFAALREHAGAVQWGEGEELEMVAGRFEIDPAQREVLEQLAPPALYLRAASSAAPALQALLQLYREEARAPALGQRALADGLARMALVQALRAQEAPAGWLGALRDPKIGAALRLLHAEPARRWTVQELAAGVAMSRSALALRFRRLVGCAPLHYLQQWRMRLARQILLSEELPVSTLAWRLGYASESAFSAAFRKATGHAPGGYRDAMAEAHVESPDWQARAKFL